MHEDEANNDEGTGQSTPQISDSNVDNEGGNEMDNTDWSIDLPASKLLPSSTAAESSLPTVSRDRNNLGIHAGRKKAKAEFMKVKYK